MNRDNVKQQQAETTGILEYGNMSFYCTKWPVDIFIRLSSRLSPHVPLEVDRRTWLVKFKVYSGLDIVRHIYILWYTSAHTQTYIYMYIY